MFKHSLKLFCLIFFFTAQNWKRCWNNDNEFLKLVIFTWFVMYPSVFIRGRGLCISFMSLKRLTTPGKEFRFGTYCKLALEIRMSCWKYIHTSFAHDHWQRSLNYLKKEKLQKLLFDKMERVGVKMGALAGENGSLMLDFIWIIKNTIGLIYGYSKLIDVDIHSIQAQCLCG